MVEEYTVCWFWDPVLKRYVYDAFEIGRSKKKYILYFRCEKIGVCDTLLEAMKAGYTIREG